MISDSCWFAFCFAYSVESRGPRGTDLLFLKVQSTAAHHGWDELIVAKCCFVTLAGHIQTQTQSSNLIDNSIIIADEGPRVDVGLALIYRFFHLVDLLFEKWVSTALISVSIFHCLEPVEFIILNYILHFHNWKPSLRCQKRKQQLFYGDTVIIIWACETRGELRLGTSRMSIVMFAGNSAKCQY